MGVRFLPSTLRPSVLLTLNGSFDGLFIVLPTSEHRDSGSAEVHDKRHLELPENHVPRLTKAAFVK